MAAPSVTYTLVNGTTADANQVNQNFSDLVNALGDGTRDVTINMLTTNGNTVLGSNSADNLTINATLISHIIPTNTTYTLGDSTHNFTDLFLDNGATDGGAVAFNAGGSTLLSSADGATLTIGGFTSIVGAASGPKNIINAWLNYNGQTSTIVDSINISSVTDNAGAGDFTVNFTTAFANTNYILMGTSGAGIFDPTTAGKTVSAHNFTTYSDAGTLTDAILNYIIAVGAR